MALMDTCTNNLLAQRVDVLTRENQMAIQKNSVGTAKHATPSPTAATTTATMPEARPAFTKQRGANGGRP
jgi:hypothetical protein